jgi:YARHG domain/zinc-ribbon domain
MDVCPNCGEKLYESNSFCTKCGSRVAKDNENISSTLRTRMEIKKNRLKKKRLLAGVGSIIGLLLVISVTSLMVKGYHKPEPKSNVAVTKTIDQSKDQAIENKDQSSHDHHSTEEKSHESSNLSSSDHILPVSDKRVMSEEDIANLTKGQLRLARNEIYARHGYVFKSQDLQKYFSSKSWYHPDPSFDGSLNEVEKENVDFIKAREDSL